MDKNIIKLMETINDFRDACVAQVINIGHSNDLHKNIKGLHTCYEAEKTADLFKLYIAQRSANIKPMVELMDACVEMVLKSNKTMCKNDDVGDTSKSLCTTARKLHKQLQTFNKNFK